MTTKATLFLSFALLGLSGCASMPAEIAAEMKAAAKKYDAVSKNGVKDATKASLIAALGAPQEEEARKAVWEVRYNGVNYEKFTVEFHPDGKVAKWSRVHWRGSVGPGWKTESHELVEMDAAPKS